MAVYFLDEESATLRLYRIDSATPLTALTTPGDVLRAEATRLDAVVNIPTDPLVTAPSLPLDPVTTSSVTINSTADLVDGYIFDQSGVDITIATNLTSLELRGSNLRVRQSAGVTVDSVFIRHSNERIHFDGGNYGQIEFQIPASFFPTTTYNAAWFIQDVKIENCTFNNPTGPALKIRGHRIYVLDCNMNVQTYGIWAGDTGPLDQSDFTVLNNTMVGSGQEATIRVFDVLRGVLSGNTLTNPSKQNLRVHGRSDDINMDGNILIGGGIMLGIDDTDTTDDIGTAVFDNNIIHNITPGIITIDENYITTFASRDNTIYSDIWAQYWPGAIPSGWLISNNPVQVLANSPYSLP